MKIDKNIIAVAALLHDVGKLMRRSGEKGTHYYNSYRFIKDLFNNSQLFSYEETEYIAKLAYNHHNSKNDNIDPINSSVYLRIIKDSDCDSAAERKTYTGEPEKSIELNPLSSIISGVNSSFFDDIEYKDLLFYYPAECNKGYPEKYAGTGKTKKDAKKMIDGFKNEAMKVLKKSQTKEDFINSLYFLIKKYMSYVTSSGKEKLRDISLYHHSFTTAAFAVNRFINLEKSDNYNTAGNYILLLGKIFDGERYVFDNLNKNIEKPLRRVFTRINLLTVINTTLPYQIVRELGLFAFNVVYSAGGTFALILPQVLKKDVEKIIENEKSIISHISEMFEHKIYVECAIKNINLHKPEKYDAFRIQFFTAANELNQKRFRRSLNGLVMDLTGEYSICKNCGINTSNGEYCRACDIENQWMKINIKNFKINYNRADIRYIGKPELLSEDKEEPYIFFDYDYSQNAEDMTAAVRQVGKYEIIKEFEMCKLCRYKDNCDIKEEVGTVSLNCLAGTSPNDALLATAKIDLDDIEFLLYHAYPLEKFGERYPFSVSRLSYLSDQIDLFFSHYVPEIIKTKYKNRVMVLLGGGDEIILTGVWEDILKAVIEIEKAFEIFVADTKQDKRKISISSAIVFHRSHVPFSFILSDLNKKMKCAKCSGDCVAVNDLTITYLNLNTAMEYSDKIKKFVENNWISRNFLFDMLSILLISNDKKKKGAIAAARRAALFNYSIERNVMTKDDLQQDVKEHIRTTFYELMIKKKNLYFSKFIIELAIRKTKRKEDDE